MKVRVFHTLASEGRTSMEVYARELAKGLEDLRETGLAVSHWWPANWMRTMLGGRAFDRAAGYFDRYLAYQVLIWRHDADVNHIIDHGYGHLGFSLDPNRTVVTFHDAMLLKLRAHELPTTVYPRLAMLGHKLSLSAITRAARVIADSESSRQDFLRFVNYPAERVRVIPLGVAPEFRPQNTRLSNSAEQRIARILHVGHCEPYKNIEAVLRAVPLVSREIGRPVELIKVGGPFGASQLALIGQLGLELQVRHLGMVGARDLPRTYGMSDVLLMPSWYEGFGLPVLEAMACGTPVIASKRGSLPEVVGDAGVLVDPADIADIVQGVARVLTNPQLEAELRQRGIQRASTFTWGRTARETLLVYREVAEETG